MKTAKRTFSLLLALCLAFSLSVSGFASAASAASDETADTPAVIDEEENTEENVEIDEETGTVTISVSTAEELSAAMLNSNYGNYETLIIHLTNNITMTSSDVIAGWSHKNIIIDGKTADGTNYTLTGPEGTDQEYKMFMGSNSSGKATNGGVSLTFQNINIDANRQYFIYSKDAYLKDASISLDNVNLINAYGKTTTAAIYLYGTSSAAVKSLGLKNVTTNGCVGTLIYIYYINGDISIENSTLETTMEGESSNYAYVIYARRSSSDWSNLLLKDSTIQYTDTSSSYIYGIYDYNNFAVTIDNSKIIGTGNNDSSAAFYTNNNSSKLNIKDSTIENTNGTRAKINLNDKTTTVTVGGKVLGSPEIVLTRGTPLTLNAGLEEPIYYSYYNSSITGYDPIVVQGTGEVSDSETDDDTEKDAGYFLKETDLEKLIYADEESIRTLQMGDPDTYEGEETNAAYLHRVDFNDCDVSLLGYDSKTTTEKNGVTTETYYYTATQYDGEIKPDVQVTMPDGTEVPKSNYALTYTGDYEVTAEDKANTQKAATVTVTPQNDFYNTSEDAVTLNYVLQVPGFVDLGTAPVSVEFTYDTDKGEYNTTVMCGEDVLEEGVDYNISYRIDSENWSVEITITGTQRDVDQDQGGTSYGGTFTLSVDLLGKESKVRTVYDEETLSAALADQVEQIYITDDIGLSEPAVVTSDVLIASAVPVADEDGDEASPILVLSTEGDEEESSEGYRIWADDLYTDGSIPTDTNIEQAVLEVMSGSVTVYNVALDGNNKARVLYVDSSADVTMDGGAALRNAHYVGQGQTVHGALIYLSGGTLTLNECTVEGCEAGYNYGYYIYNNGGTMNVNDGAYFSGIPSDANYAAIYCTAGATLNWDGGIYDAWDPAEDSGESYVSRVVENYGTFNLISGTITGSGPNGELTETDYGVIANGASGILNMSDGQISGFCVMATNNTGSKNGYTPVGGGGVYNQGTFNMTGGVISGNTAMNQNGNMNVGTIVSGGMGGGVFNLGTFNLSGGTITDNTAAQGGGVYNDCPRSGNTGGGKFIMTGGVISGNHLIDTVIEETETSNQGMGFDNDYGPLTYAGSQIYCLGDSPVTISGGTISGDGNELTLPSGESVQADIAVVVTDEVRGANGYGPYTQKGCASITITGDPEMSNTGVLLVNEHEITQPIKLNNYLIGDYDGEDFSTWDWEIPGLYVYEDGEGQWIEDGVAAEGYGYYESVQVYSWIDLYGGLTSEFNVATLTAETITLNSSYGGQFNADGISLLDYVLNQDGDVIARYADRVTPAASDGDLLKTSEGVSIYQDNVELSVIYTEDEGMGNDSSQRIEDTLEFDGWFICGHTAMEYLEASDATCTTDGNVACWYCPTCGKYFADEDGTEAIAEETAILPALGHDASGEYLAETDPADCVTDGHHECYLCSRCGAYVDMWGNALRDEDVIIPAPGHTVTEDSAYVEALDPTCTEDGHIGYYICDVCGACVDADGNELTDEELTANGKLSAAGHGPVLVVPAKAATETEDGNITYFVCLTCGGLFADVNCTQPLTSEEIVIPAGSTEENPDEEYGELEGVVNDDDTALNVSAEFNTGLLTPEEQALLEEGADICFELDVSDLDAADIDEDVIAAVLDALSEYLEEGTEPDIYYLEINLLKYMDEDVTQVTEALSEISITLSVPEELLAILDEAEEGTCTFGIVRAHVNAEDEAEVDLPDCEYDPDEQTLTFATDAFGVYGIVLLPVTDEGNDDDQPGDEGNTPDTGDTGSGDEGGTTEHEHDWDYDNPVVTWNEDRTEVTVEISCSSDPTHVASGSSSNIEITTVDADCTTDGSVTYTAVDEIVISYDGNAIAGVTNIAITDPVAALGHSWDDGAVTVEPTADEPGEMTYTCTVCGETYTEEIPALGSSDDDTEEPDDTDKSGGSEQTDDTDKSGGSEQSDDNEESASKVDTTALGGLYDMSIAKLSEENYTEESWLALVEAQEAALEVLNDADATEADVQEAWLNLFTAVAGLELNDSVTEVNKDALGVLYEALQLLNEDDFSEEEWAEIQAAAESIAAVLANDDATQDDVNAAISDAVDAVIGAIDSDFDYGKDYYGDDYGKGSSGGSVTTAPKTDDSAHFMLSIVMMAVCAALVIILVSTKRKGQMK